LFLYLVRFFPPTIKTYRRWDPANGLRVPRDYWTLPHTTQVPVLSVSLYCLSTWQWTCHVLQVVNGLKCKLIHDAPTVHSCLCALQESQDSTRICNKSKLVWQGKEIKRGCDFFFVFKNILKKFKFKFYFFLYFKLIYF
jgi:hypothetical protein